MPEKPTGDQDGESVGIFPSWRWLYGTIVVYTALLIFLLYIFTVTLDHSAS